MVSPIFLAFVSHCCFHFFMTLKEAYDSWIQCRPFKSRVERRTISYEDDGVERTYEELAHFDGHCCWSGHFYKKIANGVVYLTPKEDHDVCPRERAWRVYVRVRDAVPSVH